MSLPWTFIDAASTRDGRLVLQRHGVRACLITLDGRVLMNSVDHHSEAALGRLACRHLRDHPRPKVMVGGLGMGITLRAALDVLPPAAEVRVMELNPVTERWCRGPIADLSGNALDDPRVQVSIIDFADALREVVRARERFDAILIDLYVGPDARTRDGDPLYGREACERAAAALAPGGVFAVWAEAFHESYARRLRAAGLQVEREHPARGSRRFVVYVATKPRSSSPHAGGAAGGHVRGASRPGPAIASRKRGGVS